MTLREAIEQLKPDYIIYVDTWHFYTSEDGSMHQGCCDPGHCDADFKNKEELLKSSFVKSLLKRKAEVEEL